MRSEAYGTRCALYAKCVRSTIALVSIFQIALPTLQIGQGKPDAGWVDLKRWEEAQDLQTNTSRVCQDGLLLSNFFFNLYSGKN